MYKYIIGLLFLALVMASSFSILNEKEQTQQLAAVSNIEKNTTLNNTNNKGTIARISDDTSSLGGNPLTAKEFAEFNAFMSAESDADFVSVTRTQHIQNTNKELPRKEYTGSDTSGRIETNTACPCVCPYGKIIVVLGVKSKPGDKEYEWFKEHFPSAELIPLRRSAGDAKFKEIKERIMTQVNDPVCPKQKILLIGYSMGAAIVKSLEAECADCADIIAIDPPYPSKICTRTLVWLSKPFSAQLRQICKASPITLTGNDEQINWTNGNSLNPDHYPWNNLTKENVRKLEELKETIYRKINTCRAPKK